MNNDLVEKSRAHESAGMLLGETPKIILGVSEKIAETLANVGVRTVLDLAESELFNQLEFLRTNPDANSLERKRTLTALVGSETASDLSLLTPNDLVRLDPGVRTELGAAFPTLDAMATWPPFARARRLREGAKPQPLPQETTSTKINEREGIPDELVPVARRYATQKTSVTRNFLDRFGAPGSDLILDPSPLTRLSLTDARTAQFDVPALGARLTMEHTLTPEGISLGRLLHSLALAPGESTNVAIVDFTRAVGTSAEENINQTEALSAETEQNQEANSDTSVDISENQSGRTDIDSTVDTESGSVSAGAGVGGGGGGVLAGVGVGGTRTNATTTTDTSVVTSTLGTRNVDAQASEELLRQTQQASASERDRRASLITEVSEAEGSRAETRNVTNYNHMHTLSVHYYEVVQIHEVSVRAVRAEALLFTPVAPIDFSDPALIAEHREALAAAAPDERTRRLILGVDRMIPLELLTKIGKFRGSPFRSYGPADAALLGITGSYETGRYSVPPDLEINFIEFDAIGPENAPFMTPKQVLFELEGGIVVDIPIPEQPSGFFVGAPVDPPIKVEALRRVRFVYFAQPRPSEPVASFQLFIKRGDITASVSFRADTTGHQNTETILGAKDDTSRQQVISTLQRDRMRYSIAVYQALGPQTLVAMFAGKTFAGLDLSSAIEPRIVATHGNLLGFPLRIDENGDGALSAWWKDWLERNFHPERVSTDYVAAPTGGVHAEGILGRANTAERFDLTRFWDWQDSPIPNLPPRISDVSAESRASVGGAPTPGSLDPSVVNIQNLPAMTDPVNAQAALNAALASTPFRDMSGLAAADAVSRQGIGSTVDLAQTTARESASLARTALSQVLAAGATGPKASTNSDVGAHIAYQEDREKARGGITEEPGAPDRTSENTSDPTSAADRTKTAEAARALIHDGIDEGKKAADDEAKKKSGKSSKPAPDLGHVVWLSDTPGAQELLLYNFPLGDANQPLHPRHIEALRKISVQIGGIDDIAVVEGRASTTVTKSDEAGRDNSSLSITRMENVWVALMEFALVPAPFSSVTKQQAYAATSPIRPKYPALAKIPTGPGDEDAVERSVLIRLSRQVDPRIKPEPTPEVPGISTFGHVAMIEEIDGDANIISQQSGGIFLNANDTSREIVKGDKIGEVRGIGQINAKKVEGNTLIANGGGLNINLIFPGVDAKPGEKVEAKAEAQPTKQWVIEIRRPCASGLSPVSAFDDVVRLIKALQQVGGVAPSVELEISVPEDLGTATVVDFNPSKLISTAAGELAEAISQSEILKPRLSGLVFGRTQVDAVIRPVYENGIPDGFVAPLLNLTGEGMSYWPREANDAETTDILKRFDYETDTPLRLSDWSETTKITDVKLSFSKSTVGDDIASAAAFVVELAEKIPALGVVVPGDLISELGNLATNASALAQLAGGGEKMTFSAEGQPEREFSSFISASSAATFRLEEGLFTKAKK
ncbi:MAG: hypothetical protein AAGE89_00395 [Pseudomonadota bacterium]